MLDNLSRELNEPGVKRHPGLWRVHIGMGTSISIVHSKHVGLLLKEPKSKIYDFLLPWLGEGLLISEGNKWFRNRKLLTPAFHYSILRNYVSIYNNCVSVLLDKWRPAARREESVQVFEAVCPMSLDIILQCAFSFQSGCQGNQAQHPYVQACRQLIPHISERFFNPIYRIHWLYWYTAHGKKMKELCKTVHDYAENVIAERRATLSACDMKKVKETNSKVQYDFLDILLLARDQDGKGMEDLEIRNEVDTFMFEGHDTTTSGMSWTLYCLAKNPEHQVKIREEVRDILKGRQQLEYDDLQHLNYTTWCIKESMRLYPPVYGFSRRASRDIRVGEYTIPEGEAINISTYQIHHNSDIWENPMEYNPLRFQPDNVKKRGPYDYIPFSAGNRNCIGQNFAMIEMKVIIGSIVNRFELRLDEDHYVEILTAIILKTKNDIKLYLKEIK